jgi:hypothetical protein
LAQFLHQIGLDRKSLELEQHRQVASPPLHNIQLALHIQVLHNMAQVQHTEVLERKQALVIDTPQVVQRTRQVLHTKALGKPLGQRMALRR